MQEMIEYFLYLNKFNWGDGPYQWMFYIGLFLTLIFEKKKIARIVFGWLPIVFLLAIYNPIFNQMIRIVFPNPDAYYVRMFSFIPVTYGIGIGIMQLIVKLKGWIKFITLAGLAIVLIISCTDVYKALDMKPSENPEKVPAGLVEVINAIHSDDQQKVCVAVPYPLSTSIRQVDATLITPYGRDDGLTDTLHRELSQDVPNASVVMDLAGKRSVDYIVTHKNDECQTEFRQQGYEPYAETSIYSIYAVENVPKVRRIMDEKNRIISITSIDADGNPIKTQKGYTTILYGYDNYGNRNKETYLDEQGEKYTLPAGYASIQKKYRFPSGLLESVIYLDDKDEPVKVNGCYEIRNTYNSNKKLSKESFFDQFGNPMLRTDLLYASRELEYNNSGQMIRESFYGLNNEPVVSSAGYASYSREFDERKRLVGLYYYDVYGKPTKGNDGYAGVLKRYDENDNMINETYIDENEEIENCIIGYAEIRWEYDEHKRITSESYWDKHGRPAYFTGYHRIEKEYDTNDNVIEERMYDQIGKLTLCDKGYAIDRRTWNEKGQLLTEKYYDENDMLVNNSSGFASIEIIYENDVMIKEIRRDVDGNEL